MPKSQFQNLWTYRKHDITNVTTSIMETGRFDNFLIFCLIETAAIQYFLELF